MSTKKIAKNKARPETRPATSSIRWSPEDWKLIDKLQKKTGIRSWTEVVRKALRDSAEKEGLST